MSKDYWDRNAALNKVYEDLTEYEELTKIVRCSLCDKSVNVYGAVSRCDVTSCPVIHATNDNPPDNVNSPAHYNQGEIECIDAMVQVFGLENVQMYARINAFKYLWRHGYKNGDEDISKACWYLRFSQGDDPRKD